MLDNQANGGSIFSKRNDEKARPTQANYGTILSIFMASTIIPKPPAQRKRSFHSLDLLSAALTVRGSGRVEKDQIENTIVVVSSNWTKIPAESSNWVKTMFMRKQTWHQRSGAGENTVKNNIWNVPIDCWEIWRDKLRTLVQMTFIA